MTACWLSMDGSQHIEVERSSEVRISDLCRIRNAESSTRPESSRTPTVVPWPHPRMRPGRVLCGHCGDRTRRATYSSFIVRSALRECGRIAEHEIAVTLDGSSESARSVCSMASTLYPTELSRPTKRRRLSRHASVLTPLEQVEGKTWDECYDPYQHSG
jgi:hypothetical protein